MPTDDANPNADTTGRWGRHESEMLAVGHKRFGDSCWTQLSRWLAAQGVYRCPTQCRHHWMKTMRPDLKKGHWSEDEDARLAAAVRAQQLQHGVSGDRGSSGMNWSTVAQAVTHRTGKACRDRWVSHLDPRINHTPLTEEEDKLILYLHATVYKNQWSKIAERLPGRTAEAVKSKWKTLTGFRWQSNKRVRTQAVHGAHQQCDHAVKRQKVVITTNADPVTPSQASVAAAATSATPAHGDDDGDAQTGSSQRSGGGHGRPCRDADTRSNGGDEWCDPHAAHDLLQLLEALEDECDMMGVLKVAHMPVPRTPPPSSAASSSASDFDFLCD